MIIYPESGQLAPPLSPPTNISLLGYLDGLSIRGLPASLPDPPPLQESILSIAGRVTPYKCESDHSLPCLKHVSDFGFPHGKPQFSHRPSQVLQPSRLPATSLTSFPTPFSMAHTGLPAVPHLGLWVNDYRAAWTARLQLSVL